MGSRVERKRKKLGRGGRREDMGMTEVEEEDRRKRKE